MKAQSEHKREVRVPKAAVVEGLDPKTLEIFDAIPQGIFVWDAAGNLLYINRRLQDYHGQTPDNLQAKDFRDQVYHPDDLAAVNEARMKAIEQGIPMEITARLLRKDARYIWFLVRANPVRDKSGEIVQWYGTLTEIDEQLRRTEELRRNEFYLAEGQRLAHVGSWSTTHDGTCDYWSLELYHILGFYPSSEIPTIADYLGIVHPEDRPYVEEAIKRMIAHGEGCDVKKRIIRRTDGAQRIIRCVAKPMRDNGTVVRFIGTVMDITEQELLTEELRRREAFLTEAQRLSLTGSFGWNISADAHFWSEETYRIFGYEPGARITMQSIIDRVHPEDASLVERTIARAGDGMDLDFEYRLLLPGGEVRHLHVVAHAVRGSSKSLEFVGAVKDITERRRTEEALRRSEQQWKDVFENNPTMYFVVDANGITLSVNPYGAEQLGYSVEELVGRPVLNIFHEPDRGAAQRHVTECLDHLGQAFSWELRKVRKEGTVLWVRETARGVTRGEQSIVLIACEDITDRKRAEEAVRRSEALLEEGQRISHTGSWLWNPATGELTSSKERFRIFGLDPDKPPSSMQVFSERVHPDDKARLRKILDAAVREKRDFQFEYRIVTPDWAIKHVHTIAHAAANESGELVEYYGSTADITERKRAEERTHHQKEAIRLALNSFVEQLDLDRFLGHVLSGLAKQFHAASAELWLFDDATGDPSLHLAFQKGKGVITPDRAGKPDLQPESPPVVTWHARRIGRVPRVIQIPAEESALQPAHFDLLVKQGVKTLMKVPMAIGDQLLGVFELDFVEATRFAPEDLDAAQALVHHATLALQLSRLAHRTETLAVIEERNRMAREIHDTLAQAFAGIVLHSEALGGSLEVSKARTKRALLRIKKLARSGLEEARRSVQALRPKALEGSSLQEALEEAATRLSKDAELSCEFKQMGKLLNLSPEVQDELFRIAQEAMTNVRKHARAASAWITLEFGSSKVILTIRDDGVGLGAAATPDRKGGYGLASMRERAQRIGGRLEIENPEKGGMVIRVTVPVVGKHRTAAGSERAAGS